MSSQSAAAYFTPTGPVDPELKCNNYTLKEDEEEAKRRKRDRKRQKRRKEGRERERKREKVRD